MVAKLDIAFNGKAKTEREYIADDHCTGCVPHATHYFKGLPVAWLPNTYDTFYFRIKISEKGKWLTASKKQQQSILM